MSELVKSVCILFWVLCAVCLWSWYLVTQEASVGFLGLGTLMVGLLLLLSMIWDMLELSE